MLEVFTVFHVAISVTGIVSGLIVLSGLLKLNPMQGWTKLFLATTAATSITGFLFPFHGFTPAIGLGIMSVLILAIAYAARYRFHMKGSWRKTYVITAVLALYFNCFVLVVQSFQKIPALHDVAPTQSEPPFQIAQLAVLLLFIALGTFATIRFGRAPRAAGAHA